jgi:hypothetical protein
MKKKQLEEKVEVLEDGLKKIEDIIKSPTSIDDIKKYKKKSEKNEVNKNV